MELPMAPKVSPAASQDHQHSHGGHDHHHHHDGDTYDYEQLLGISVTAILGIASLYLYFSDRLLLILAPKFHIWVLVSGLGLLALAATRTWLVFTGHKAACCSHDHHTHEHDAHNPQDGCCQHDSHNNEGKQGHHHNGQDTQQHQGDEKSHQKANYGHTQGEHSHQKTQDDFKEEAHSHHHQEKSHTHHHHTHEHGHDHSHGSGFLPLQTMILLSPIVLLMGLPGEVFNSSQALSANEVEASTREIGDKGQDFEVTFLQLERAAAHPETRNYYEGKTIRLTGRFVGDDDKRFTLIRYKINCCAADAVPLNSIIMVDPKYPERLPLQKLRSQWVEVTGKVQFLKKVGKEEYVSSLILKPEEGKNLDSIIKIVPQDANPYVN